MHPKNQFFSIISCIAVALMLRFFVIDHLLKTADTWWMQAGVIAVVFIIGIGYIFRTTANVIEETTDILKDRTGLAGGFLQALGTAFPDMVIGIVAAVISLQVRSTDYVRAINLAIIAASTTFGSNIYNILHATWCVYRQNVANVLRKEVRMVPGLNICGTLKPIERHSVKPSIKEMDGAIRILTALTMLTALTVISMVACGHVRGVEEKIAGDLYQLIPVIGMGLAVLCAGILYYFRKNHHPKSPIEEIIQEERYYAKQPTLRIWTDLALSGIAILFAAESMVKTMEVFSHLTHIPFVVTGIMAGLIGCFGEMMVVHNFSVNPKGRIGDAIVGVAMDNIVTTLGAAIVAIMGGIFLGGKALILIFIIILAANTLLIEQISKLKNSLYRS